MHASLCCLHLPLRFLPSNALLSKSFHFVSILLPDHMYLCRRRTGIRAVGDQEPMHVYTSHQSIHTTPSLIQQQWWSLMSNLYSTPSVSNYKLIWVFFINFTMYLIKQINQKKSNDLYNLERREQQYIYEGLERSQLFAKKSITFRRWSTSKICTYPDDQIQVRLKAQWHTPYIPKKGSL